MWEIVNKPSPSEDILNKMARAQDKAIGLMSAKSFSRRLAGPLNAISTNKDGTQIAAAGRAVFMILNIEDTGFTEKINLRVGRISLNFAITDVQWSQLDDSVLATAAGNGAVVLWDLNKVSKSKQEHVFTDHKRTVNKICFHPTDPNILMSGSQDGTMNCFDIRRKVVAHRFFGKSNSIRDVQFNPFDRNIFAAGCEGGSIQNNSKELKNPANMHLFLLTDDYTKDGGPAELWDIRRTDNFYQRFQGHTGPVFCLDWHPEDRNWIGTGGRDKTVKIWNVHNRQSPIHCVHTIAEVACIKWRPSERFHIASSALVIDYHINIWDIRRPYIPYAAFIEHKDVATDLLWHKDQNVLLSCSKDYTVFHHAFHDAIRPAEQAPTVGLGMSVRGDVCNAFATQVVSKNGRKSSLTRSHSQQPPAMPVFFKRPVVVGDEFRPVTSVLKIYHCQETLSEDWFQILAVNYEFTGKPFEELCDHNAQVSSDLGFHQKAQSWQILKLLYTEINIESAFGSSSSSFLSNPGQTHFEGRPGMGSPVSIENHADDANSSSDEGNEVDSHVAIQKSDDIALALGPELDAFFADDQFDSQLFSTENLNDEAQDWTLPSEAFQLRHTIGERSLSTDYDIDHTDAPVSPTDPDTGEHSSSGEKIKEDQKQSSSTPPLKPMALPEWQFSSLVADMLRHFAEQGDVQTSVTALLVLNDRIKGVIDMATQEEWFLAYLDLLSHFQLWTTTTKIIKSSSLPSINTLNQNSTIIRTLCGTCNKPLPGLSGWYCKKCRKYEPCAICHLPVKGLYVWCQGCAHGGHLSHIQEWLQNHEQCPAGCGHKCEFT